MKYRSDTKKFKLDAISVSDVVEMNTGDTVSSSSCKFRATGIPTLGCAMMNST